MSENVSGTILSGQSGNESGTILSGQSGNESGTILSGQSGNESGTILSGQSGNESGTILSGQSGNESGTILSGLSEGNVIWPSRAFLQPHSVMEGYEIVSYISKSGEAEIYKGVKDGKEYAIKIYLGDRTLKKEVVDRLVGKRFKNLAHMIEWGEIRENEYEKVFYEILPFYQVVKIPLPYAELKKMIEHVNEGLHELHEMGIFHKDIKPANIMKDLDGVYRIIDFGISSVAEKGQTSINNTDGKTLNYASPDARATSKASAAEDYYSFGISIYEYFANELPYADLGDSNNRYQQLNSIGVKVRPSLNMPEELVKLIHGLTFYSNRADENKKRWGYAQVRQWLQDPGQLEDLDMEAMAQGAKTSALGGAVNSSASTVYKKSFGFAGNQLSDSYSLVEEIGAHWEEGKKQVGRGYLEEFFKENGSEYVYYRSACEDTRKEIEDAKTQMEENIAYWKLLYLLEPKLTKFYWNVAKEDGRTDYTCEELGVYFFLQPLQNQRDKNIPQVTKDIIASGLLPIYLKQQLKDEKRYQKAVALLKDYVIKKDEKTIWKLGYLFTGKAVFRYRNQTFEKKEELFHYLIEWTNSLSKAEALTVVKAFENTTEFQAWIESQGE